MINPNRGGAAWRGGYVNGRGGLPSSVPTTAHVENGVSPGAPSHRAGMFPRGAFRGRGGFGPGVDRGGFRGRGISPRGGFRGRGRGSFVAPQTS